MPKPIIKPLGAPLHVSRTIVEGYFQGAPVRLSVAGRSGDCLFQLVAFSLSPIQCNSYEPSFRACYMTPESVYPAGLHFDPKSVQILDE